MSEKPEITGKEPAAEHPGEDTRVRTAYSFCDICSPAPGCGVTCTVRDGKITEIRGTEEHPGGGGHLCTKGLALRQYIYREDRLTTPLRRVGEKGSGQFEPVSWEEAFAEIAARFKKVKDEDGASAVAFYSGYNKWYRPFLQRLCYSFGSVNYGSESSTCFTATAMSWKTAAGYDAVLPDRKNCGTFLGWGYNPCNSKNVGSGYPRKGKEKVIIVDPRITPAVKMEADLHLRPVPGTDGALAHAIARELIVRGWIDSDYIDKKVHGFPEYKEYVLRFTPEEAEKITRVPAEKIREAAEIIGEHLPLAIAQSSSAFVHHKNGYQNHRAVQALAALTGSFDVPGGMIPSPDTFGHVRAGFASDIGRFEWEKYPEKAPLPVGAEKYPLWHRLSGEMQACGLARQIREGRPYPVKAMLAMGMNYRMFNADQEMKEALLSLDFFVDTDLFLTDSARLADLVLPVCSSFERSECRFYPGGFAQYFQPVLEPAGMADDEILFELARRLDVDDDLLKSGRDACYAAILPELDFEALKADPDHPHRAEGVRKTPVGEHEPQTPTGKFELRSAIVEEFPGFEPLPVYRESLDGADPVRFPLQLVSGGRLPNALHSRLHDVPWLRSLRPEPMADLHPADAKEREIRNGDRIHLTTSAGSITVKAHVTSAVLPGTVWMYHGYREADVNSIIPPDHNDPYSGFPGFRSVRCEVIRDPAEAGVETPEEEKDRAAVKCAQEKEKNGAFRFEPEKCTGCGACAVACMDRNDILPGQKAFRRIVCAEEEGMPVFYSLSCLHCSDPACVSVCPKSCLYRETSTGKVLYDNTACTGCGLCAEACPYGAVSLRSYPDGSRKMEKCRACDDPACVRNCPTGALGRN